MEERPVLHLKVCSARRLKTPINAFVVVDFGQWSRTTSVKKQTERPIWNETFSFPFDVVPSDAVDKSISLQLKSKDVFGKSEVIGKAVVQAPSVMNELADIWIPLDMETTTIIPDLHVCMQVELLRGRSLERLSSNNRSSSASRLSLIKFGGPSLRLVNQMMTTENSRKLKTEDNWVESTFEGRAAAVTLTEICQNLDRLRGIIYLAGADSETRLDSNTRMEQLHTAKVDLDELESQIELVEGLSDEWKDKLGGLIGDYLTDCLKFLSSESWDLLAHKRQSRQPPPLPSKEEREKIRSSRALSFKSQGEIISKAIQRSQPPQPLTLETGVLTSASLGSPVVQQLDSPSSPISPLQSFKHTPIIRDHYLTSIEAFDHMMDFGYVMECKERPKSRSFGKQGDVARFKLTSYVYDAAICKAVSYDGPVSVETVIGVLDAHNDIPRGLALALQRVQNGAKNVIVTVTPEYGFAEDGHIKGVPPNSTLMFEVSDFSTFENQTL